MPTIVAAMASTAAVASAAMASAAVVASEHADERAEADTEGKPIEDRWRLTHRRPVVVDWRRRGGRSARIAAAV
jgi:hypothetical protein